MGEKCENVSVFVRMRDSVAACVGRLKQSFALCDRNFSPDGRRSRHELDGVNSRQRDERRSWLSMCTTAVNGVAKESRRHLANARSIVARAIRWLFHHGGPCSDDC